MMVSFVGWRVSLKEELAQAREIDQDRNAPKGMMAMMMAPRRNNRKLCL